MNADLKAIGDAVIASVKAYVERSIARALAEHETRIKALEYSGPKSLIDAYRGTFEDGKRYERGVMVTHGGSLWFANADTTTRPGTGPHWTMCVKAGRDAR